MCKFRRKFRVRLEHLKSSDCWVAISIDVVESKRQGADFEKLDIGGDPPCPGEASLRKPSFNRENVVLEIDLDGGTLNLRKMTTFKASYSEDRFEAEADQCVSLPIRSSQDATAKSPITCFLVPLAPLSWVSSSSMLRSLLLTYQTEITILAQSAVLPVAFVLTIVSVRMTNLWARVPRPEKAIEAGLKGLSNKSILYNYYHFPARHVLICPQGIFAIVTRWHDQVYTVRDGRFRSHRNIISKAFSVIRFDGIGKPFRDAEFAREVVQRTLDDIAPDVEVRPLVVFVDPKAELRIEDELKTPVLFADPKRAPQSQRLHA